MSFSSDCDAVRAITPIDIAKVDALVARFYAMPDNGAGGTLHVVLDDTNLDDESIDWCIQQAQEQDDKYAAALGRLLRAMNMSERLAMDSVCTCGCADDLLGDGPEEREVVRQILSRRRRSP